VDDFLTRASRRSKSQGKKRSAPKPTGSGDNAEPVPSSNVAVTTKGGLSDIAADIGRRLEASAKEIQDQTLRLNDLMKFLQSLETDAKGTLDSGPRYVV